MEKFIESDPSQALLLPVDLELLSNLVFRR